MTPRPTYFTEISVKQSLEVRENVASNLSRYLGVKGKSVASFLQWVKEQNCPGVIPERFAGWPHIGSPYRIQRQKNVVTDPYIMYLLVANYMGKDVRDVIGGKIPYERL